MTDPGRERGSEPDEECVEHSSRALVLDVMLGGLVSYLRMCGYDTAYALDRDCETDEAVARLARREGRLLLTRDRQLASRVDASVLLERREVTDQLRELLAAGFALCLPPTPSRCGACNTTLERVPPAVPTPEYAPDSDATAVWRCPSCGQHFWRGSHWDDVAATLSGLR